jgi:hypothetical protein
MLSSCAKDNLVFAAIGIAVVIVIALISYIGGRPRFSNAYQNRVRQLARDTLRYISMSEQDKDEATALVHATYAHAYWTILRSYASDRDISTIAKIQVHEVHDLVNTRQHACLVKVSKADNVSKYVA